MPINVNTTPQQIGVSVGETQIDVAVSGGVGPTGNSGTIAVSAPITNTGTSTAAVIGLSVGTGLVVSGGQLFVVYGTSAATACQGNDFRLSDTREWSASTVTLAEAEAGTSTSRRAFTPQRVFQAIAAWWAGSAAKSKLDGIATGATANATDAQLRDRATHTGTQLAATISDFASAVVAAAPPTTNASLLTSGTLPDARLSSNIARTSDVSSAVAAVVNAAPATLDTLNELAAALGNDANFATTVTNSLAAKAPIASPTFTGTVSGVTKAMVGLGNVDNTSDANKPISTATQTALDGKAASSHTHTASAITDFTAAVVAAAPPTTDASLLTTGTLSASRLPSTTVAAGSYGSASSVATFTVDAAGRLTAAGSTSIAVAAGAVSGLAAIATSGSASDLSAGTVPFARLPVGTTSTTVAAGNDARLSDTRTPTDGSVTDAKIATAGLSASSINWVAIQPWAANTAYSKGDLVSFDGVAYRRTSAGTSGATFNTAMWQAVTPATFVGSQITSGTIATARLGSGTASSANYLRGDGAWNTPTAADVGAAATADVLDFTLSTKPAAASGSGGSYTYTIPSTAKAIRVYMIGGGGGGGSGRRGAAGSARFGGGGGASGGYMEAVISTNDWGASRTVTVAVGNGGAGGAAQATNDSNGNNGFNGQVSSITINSKTISAPRGGGGGGGQAASGTGGNTFGAQPFAGQSGGNSSATANAASAGYSGASYSSSGGGGGGGISTGDVSFNGGGTRLDASYNESANLNSGGTAPGGAGTNGLTNSFGFPLPGGSASGGGAGNASTAGGAGGNGGDYGGGGGGGGASFNGFNSGAGGNGGPGFVRIVVYY